MDEFNILSAQRPDEELIRIIASCVVRWWHDHEDLIIALDKIFYKTCTMDKLGFIHDKHTGKIIAGSKLDWVNNMMEV